MSLSYLTKALQWAIILRRENNPILNYFVGFTQCLRAQFGDQDCETIVSNGKLVNIKQNQFKNIYSYINKFKRISQYSNFNESAKIYMFLQGLHKIREYLAIVNPSPNELNRLYQDVINIQSLTRRNNINERFYNFRNDQASSSTNDEHSDPMDVDLMRIRNGSKFNQHYITKKPQNYADNQDKHEDERKKGLCFICKKTGHLHFNCPERKKPKHVRTLHASSSYSTPSATLRRIMKIDDSMDTSQILEIIENTNSLPKRKNNILKFYIKPEDRDEIQTTVLIDSGSYLNFVHPDFIKKHKIKTNEIKPFRVTGLGKDVSIVESITDKCILRFRNHFEIIQLYVLRIPDVDIIYIKNYRLYIAF